MLNRCEWKETKGFSDTYKVYFFYRLCSPEGVADIFHSVNNFVARIRSVSIRRGNKTFTAETVYSQFIFVTVQ